MKTNSLLLILLLFLLPACKKEQKETPECIKELISTYSFCKDGGSVDQYAFQGQTVYVFDPGLCGADMAAGVYNENCQCIGMLGGIAGNNIINNVLFSKNAIYLKNIWKN
jgi:hypothetical protein